MPRETRTFRPGGSSTQTNLNVDEYRPAEYKYEPDPRGSIDVDDHSFEQEERLIPLSEQEAKKGVEYISTREEREFFSDMEEFKQDDDFKKNDREIERDRRHVEDLEEQFESNFREDMLEGLMIEDLQMQNWFGEGVEVFPTLKYDDYTNQVDLVLEWEDEEEVTRLAVDVTAGMTADTLLDKLGRDEDEGILKGLTTPENRDGNPSYMSQVKYYETFDGLDSERFSLNQVPKVVLALDKKGVRHLMEDLYSKNEEGDFELNRDKAETHPAQMILLKEAKNQLHQQLVVALEGLPSIVLENMDSQQEEALIEADLEQEESLDSMAERLKQFLEKISIEARPQEEAKIKMVKQLAENIVKLKEIIENKETHLDIDDDQMGDWMQGRNAQALIEGYSIE
ncbi:MAG: hypothetical protein ABEJ24_05795 [Candidatus Magasanikbacteria bacterium]